MIMFFFLALLDLLESCLPILLMIAGLVLILYITSGK